MAITDIMKTAVTMPNERTTKPGVPPLTHHVDDLVDGLPTLPTGGSTRVLLVVPDRWVQIRALEPPTAAPREDEMMARRSESQPWEAVSEVQRGMRRINQFSVSPIATGQFDLAGPQPVMRVSAGEREPGS